MSNDYLFTSESVSEGHPDKVADQISDAILDAILTQDPAARVAAETLCNTGLVVLAGEITTHANVDYIQVARETIKRIGYDNTEYGIDYKGCAVLVAYDKQSPDIAQGVDEGAGIDLDQGAGDQGLMFGYACDETAELMPAAIHYAHRLVERQSQLRKDGRLPWLRPDAKSQLTVKYVDGKPVRLDSLAARLEGLGPQLRERDQQMRLALDSLGGGRWEWDIAHQKLSCYGRFYAAFGMEAADSDDAWERWHARRHPADAARLADKMERAKRGQLATYEAEFRILDTAGRWRWVISRGLVGRRDAAGRPLTLMGMEIPAEMTGKPLMTLK